MGSAIRNNPITRLADGSYRVTVCRGGLRVSETVKGSLQNAQERLVDMQKRVPATKEQ